jgi:hypothetical protein
VVQSPLRAAELNLARVHMRLGDSKCEDGQFEAAVDEYNAVRAAPPPRAPCPPRALARRGHCPGPCSPSPRRRWRSTRSTCRRTTRA